MEVLIQITEVIHRHTNVYNSHLTIALQHSRQMTKLYTAIRDGVVKNDDDAKILLYGEITTSSKYFEVKRRLKSKLLACLFFLKSNDGEFTDVSSAYYTTLKTYLAARIMGTRQYSAISGILVESILPISIKYEFTDITYLLSKQLIDYYTMIKPNKHKFATYCALIKKCQRELTAETAACIALFDVHIQYANTHRALSELAITKLKNKHDFELSQFQDITTSQFIRVYYSYKIMIAEINCHNSEAYRLYKVARNKLSNKDFNLKGSIYTLDLRAVSNLIKLRNYREASKIAEYQLASWEKVELKWQKMAYYYFILCCHSEQLSKAFKVALLAYNSSRFKTLPENIKQLWYINHALSHFFLQCGKVQLTEKERSEIKKFRIYKFINDVPMYSKDKSGMNITILIIQVLFFVWEKKFNKARTRINSMSRYCNKYLRDDDTYRSNCFVKMLMELAKAEFHPIRGQRYAQKLHDKLIAMPLSKSRQAIEVEIVPYEHLWDLILEMCERRINGTK